MKDCISLMEMLATIPTIRCRGDLAVAMEKAPVVELDSFWSERDDRPAALTQVRLAWEPRGLHVWADLEDADVVTTATGDSQHLWELGDVFEIFLEAEGAGFYSEMHVSPGNHRMHLRIRPGEMEAVSQRRRPLADMMIRPPAFESECGSSATGWSVRAFIPTQVVDPKRRLSGKSQWRASFCRYDASSDGVLPVLSSTSPYEVLNFHRREEWRVLCF